ncbi:unnamed protein product [Caenorhabditis bovis]|uniref:Myosin N-terminal SH3-like domain-containing protein n=1 Tax=Caenorhabditis bovis TaxID=2654633 RepID=A0A8S1F1B0_9PELO|nr:unnamed protein product [Caenorhabditis bovis]
MSSMEYEKDPGWQYLRRSREQMLQDQSRPYDSKKNVWIPDAEEGYIEGEIKGPGPKADTLVVSAAGKDVTLKKDLVQEMNPPKFEKTEDMSNLTFLNDASVLYNLRSRYAAMLIYKSKKQLEIEQAELKSANTELIGNNAALSAMKRKVENEVQIARVSGQLIESELHNQHHSNNATNPSSTPSESRGLLAGNSGKLEGS